MSYTPGDNPYDFDLPEADSSRSMYDVAISALMKRDEKIELLEAELADTEAEVENLTDWLRETMAELADLRASSVVVRRKCETCDGSGSLSTGHLSRFPHQSEQPCPDCDDGWQLAEGVEWINISDGAEDEFDGLFVPARLIEGEE